MTQKPAFTYVDLFAGCGGLSLGLERAGGELVFAVEKSPMAAETFYHNLIKEIKAPSEWDNYLDLPLQNQVKSGLVVNELSNLLADKKIMKQVASSSIDVVVGGPPCQGFSLAGRRNPEDQRNVLPWQFLEFVEKSKPKLVVIENVVGMRHKFNSGSTEPSVFEQLKLALSDTKPGYVVQAVEVNALHFGAPQHRPRLMLIGVRSDIGKAIKIRVSEGLWKSDFADKLVGSIPSLSPIPTIDAKNVRTVANALYGLKGTGSFSKHDTSLASEYASNWKVLRKQSNSRLENHVIRQHSLKSQKRFRLYQWFASNKFDPKFLVKSAELDKSQIGKLIEQELGNIQYPVIDRLGIPLAKNKSEFIDLIDELRTKKHSQRVLSLDNPARTVVTIGDDYVHPVEPRTFTVRELARFQGFPDLFVFRAKETTGGINRRNEVPQYSQVGNAVSPMLALAVGLVAKRVTSSKPA